MPDNKPLGPTVRLKDVRQGFTTLTLKQLAARIEEHGVKISEGGLSNVENGNKAASDRLLIAWSKALGLDPLTVSHGNLREAIPEGIPEDDAA